MLYDNDLKLPKREHGNIIEVDLDRSMSLGLKVTWTINLLDSFGGRKVASLAKPYAVKSL